MEEFYRRKYLSPSFNRVPNYFESLEKDTTVAELRKQLQECKQMEGKFEDFCLQISKVQKENERLEGDNFKIKNDYLQRIQENKSGMTDLKRIIVEYKDGVNHKTEIIGKMEQENDKLLEELKFVRRQAQQNQKQKCILEIKLCEQEKIINEFQKILNDLNRKCSELKQQNEYKSGKLEQGKRQIQSKHQNLKNEALGYDNYKKELQILIQKRKGLEAKCIWSKSKLQATNEEHWIQQRECQRIQNIEGELASNVEKENNEALRANRDLKKTMAKNKQFCLKIINNQDILMQSAKNLQKDQAYLQKMEMKQAQLKKGNEKLEEVLRNLNQILGDEQENYGRIIQHMKESIIQDEKAILNLANQACLLENIIS